jgi:hypothetical protein
MPRIGHFQHQGAQVLGKAPSLHHRLMQGLVFWRIVLLA